MPNRIIKESICKSDSIEQLSWFEEVFFYRLIVNCDDYGRFDAREKIIKAMLFPLKDVTESQIKKTLDKLVSVGMVVLYEVDAKPYLQILTWGSHQQIRNKKSKYPAFDINCNQMKSNVTVIQSESESNSESECMPGAETAPDKQPVIELTLNDKTGYPIYQNQVDKWIELYPAVDVLQQLRNMSGWLNANPSKRKTKSGILRFVNSWLSREQNKGGGKSKQAHSPSYDLSAFEQLGYDVPDLSEGEE